MDTPSTGAAQKNLGAATPQRDAATPSTLGSRMRSSIPMTPRSVGGSSGIDFARQLREHNAALDPNKNSNKKFRSAAAPKGSRLASGYQDRTQLRSSTEEDEKAGRVKALEEMVKLGQMEQATFTALRDEIVGGDVKDVHLVKGLDYKLLERVRRGEDVLAESQAKAEDDKPREEDTKQDHAVDVDEALEEFEGHDIVPLEKEEKVKKGEMAPPPTPTGQKRTRDDILRDLKASRLAQADKKALESVLGSRFKKVGSRREHSRIERDAKGREVLITVDEEGNEKRKVRKVKPEDAESNGNGLLMPDKDAKPLGMDVPETKPAASMEDDVEDIFEGVGADYDPLGDCNEEDDEDEDSDDRVDDTKLLNTAAHKIALSTETESEISKPSMGPPPRPNKPDAPSRNYFTDPVKPNETEAENKINPLSDPTIVAALKRASAINSESQDKAEPKSEAEAAKLLKRKNMLASHDRDADDMDMGFGSSRFEDGEDGEDRKVKLSVWGGADDGDDNHGGDGKGKRKRGGKKRKGDANSVADVLRVMDQRKAEAK